MSGESGLERILRRDRAVVLAAVAGIAGLAWIYILSIGTAMEMLPASPSGAESGRPMDVGGAGENAHGPDGMLGAGFGAWSLGEALLMLVMWAVMMIGMMIPSAAPMLLIYARVGRQAQGRGKPFASTGWFAAGYLFSWAGFAALATLLQWALERVALLTPMMAAASPWLGAALLVAAGLYQWTALKQACLTQCQSPLLFIQRHGGFRGDRPGALALGLRHGTYCIGCCWALMALLFVGGVMNLLWIAALALLVLVEKVAPVGRLLSRSAGVALVAAGVALAAGLA